MKKFYKLARPDGWDFFSGKTIDYRGNIGKWVKCPSKQLDKYSLCSSGVLHACPNPNDCFAGASIPCSSYLVEGKPVIDDGKKFGFRELKVIEEIRDLDKLFGWEYSEAINPVNPLKLGKRKPAKEDIELLKQWASAGASVWDSVEASVGASVGDSVWASVGDSVGDSVWAYIGSMFPNIEQWKYIKHKKGEYPFQSAVNLWNRGLVPSFDGKLWRLNSGRNASIVWEGEL